MTRITDREIRIGIFNSKTSAGYVDQVEGFQAFADSYPWVKIVGIEWVPVKPVSLITEMRRLAREEPDFIWVPNSPTHAISVIKAQKNLGIHIPVLLASHNGIPTTAAAADSLELLEGHYDVTGVDPGLDKTLKGYLIIDEYRKKLGMEMMWDSVAIQGAVQNLLLLTAIERAAAKVGSNNITGEALYEAMYAGQFTEDDLLGLAPSLLFTKDAPFGTNDLKVKATTVINGKHVMVSDDWIPVPSIPRWTSGESKK
jgi:branched-chain amino acid transport system substrate-binding protein